MEHSSSSVLLKVRAALGRSGALAEPPVPPALPEPIVRLVHTNLGLADLFAEMAGHNKMLVERVYVDDLPARLIAFLTERGCRTIALPVSPFLEKLGIPSSLQAAGLDGRPWDRLTLDELYEFDCGITDVYAAVAETGSLVIRPTATHGRALSLVPPIHVAIVQPKDCVGDLLDLFEKMSAEGAASDIVLISGPSKTADIEMNLVTGVHGPGVVKVFVLQ